MSENTIDLDFGTTAQKQQDGEKLPVVLLALDQGKYDMARSLDELRALADANGMEAVAEVTQKRSTPEAATLLGEGKVAEARLVCQNLIAAAAIFDGELTGSQIRNLSAALQVEVLDRTMLILEIFRARATTNEGKLQTELATLRYQLPRLQGLGESLSRQGGGGGGGGGRRGRREARPMLYQNISRPAPPPRGPPPRGGRGGRVSVEMTQMIRMTAMITMIKPMMLLSPFLPDVLLATDEASRGTP